MYELDVNMNESLEDQDYEIIFNSIFETTIHFCDYLSQFIKKKSVQNFLLRIHRNLSEYFDKKFVQPLLVESTKLNKKLSIKNLRRLIIKVVKDNLKNLKKSLNKLNIVKNLGIRNSSIYVKIIEVGYI